MKYILCLVIVIVCGVNLCHSVKLTIGAYKNISSSVNITCEPDLDKKNEFLYNLTVTKNNQLFYSYSNDSIRKDPNHGIFQNISGIDTIDQIKLNMFVINKLNKTSAGNYNCTVYYKDKNKQNPRSRSGLAILNVTDSTPPPKLYDAKLTFSTDKVKKGNDFNLSCSYKLQKADFYKSVRVFKDDTLFVSTYKNESVRNVTGLNYKGYSLTQPTNITGTFSLAFKNVTKDAAGKYRCEVEFFANQTNWAIKAESYLSNACQHLLSYVLAIMCCIVFAINH